ncbi:MAG TPA: hypothetical protein PK668_27570 [Myxococcota bacterium]|nr:hypothetical protein [Myxococcota bacterium]HRY97288.1 hypothetical protein [Myxococcota bacterium]
MGKKKTPKWVWPLVVLALLMVVGVVIFLIICPTPDSIVEAILKRKDDLPGRYLVVLPQSAASSLGRRAEGGLPLDEDGDRRVTVEPVPCFFMAPTSRPGLGEMAIRYRSSGKLKAEMGQATQAAGVDIAEQDSAELSLSDLRLVQAVGVPNPGAPCFGQEPRQSLTVATSELVAGTAKLVFSNKVQAGLGGRSASSGDPKTKVEAGFKIAEDGSLLGKDIVLGASFSQVDVEVVRQDVDLGTTPTPGARFEFPLGLDGSVSVQSYNHPERYLEVQVSTTLNASSQPPEGLRTCAVGQPVQIASGARCDFWLAPGNGLLAVEWSMKEMDGAKHVLLHLKAYRTNFAR